MKSALWKGHDLLKKKEEKLHQLESSLREEVQPSLAPASLFCSGIRWGVLGPMLGQLRPRIGSRLGASELLKVAVTSALTVEHIWGFGYLC